MKTRQAVKICNATRISDLIYFPDDEAGQMKVCGVKPSYRYSFRQFRTAFRITKKYYERKILRYEQHLQKTKD